MCAFIIVLSPILSEGPKAFCRTRKLEDQREKWEENRASLVEVNNLHSNPHILSFVTLFGKNIHIFPSSSIPKKHSTKDYKSISCFYRSIAKSTRMPEENLKPLKGQHPYDKVSPFNVYKTKRVFSKCNLKIMIPHTVVSSILIH